MRSCLPFIVIALAVVGYIFFGKGYFGSKPVPIRGKIESNVYRNEYFGLQMTIPEELPVRTRAQVLSKYRKDKDSDLIIGDSYVQVGKRKYDAPDFQIQRIKKRPLIEALFFLVWAQNESGVSQDLEHKFDGNLEDALLRFGEEMQTKHGAVPLFETVFLGGREFLLLQGREYRKTTGRVHYRIYGIKQDENYLMIYAVFSTSQRGQVDTIIQSIRPIV